MPLTVALAPIGALFGVSSPPRQFWGLLFVRQVIAGAISGAVFATTLALVGRRWTFATLSSARVATSGAVGGAIFPILSVGAYLLHSLIGPGGHGPVPWFQFGAVVAVNSAIGAVFAGSALRIARRAPELPRLEARAVADLPAGAA